MSTNWHWGAEPKNKGMEGFNDAGILTFNSHAINSFVRELFQNSNDARDPSSDKVKICIEACKISKTDIPAFNEYVTILDAVEKSHPKQGKFFKKVRESLKSNSIPSLKYSDSLTIGLSGSESDAESSFFACVLSEGISAKQNNSAGGSFGIGKNAIYGLSNLRTVLFSSQNVEGECIFQGVAKLASYSMDGQIHEGRIYLGKDNSRMSVRDKNQIPVVFRRDDPGLTQFVVGVDFEEDWEIELTKAILRNYWMLLLDNGLEVEIKQDGATKRIIDSQNVVDLLEQFFSNDESEERIDPYGNPYYFYDAFRNGTKVDFQIPHLGGCSFYYKESEKGENNVAYLRNGMVILSNIEKRLVGAKTTGVFKCESKEGNEILRRMEPPKHDSFEPKMLEDNHETLTKKDGENILKNIKSQIREVIKSLIEKYREETETPTFLTEFFEDLQKSLHEGLKGKRLNKKEENETLYRRAVEDEITVTLSSSVQNSYISAKNAQQSGKGSGTSGGKGKTKSKRKRRGGGAGSKGKSQKIELTTSRVYLDKTENGRNIYHAFLKADAAVNNADVRLFQFADSGEESSFILHKAFIPPNKPIQIETEKDHDEIVTGYRLKQFDLPKEGIKIHLEVSESNKSALCIKG